MENWISDLLVVCFSVYPPSPCLFLSDSQVDPHDIIIVSGGTKKSFWLRSNWKYICNVKPKSALSFSNEVESCCNSSLYPSSVVVKLNQSSGKLRWNCVCACLFGPLRIPAHVYFEINSCGLLSVRRDKKKRKNKQMKGGKKKVKKASVVIWLFCLRASDLNPSHRKTGKASVILTLICKPSLCLIHLKSSVILDTATSPISGCIDNTRMQSVTVVLKHNP